ncbi:MAG TPA: hypothetical protein VMS22_01890 [Candidatus Eisenbacteria bacterium]|nr:hypothetical protein [Candidatus Eisenbacteria bacterium]
MRRDDGRAAGGRPRGAILRPLVLLIAAVATGFGMWRVLMNDEPVRPPTGEQISKHDQHALNALLTDGAR